MHLVKEVLRLMAAGLSQRQFMTRSYRVKMPGCKKAPWSNLASHRLHHMPSWQRTTSSTGLTGVAGIGIATLAGTPE
jgi:hypothetical protein